MIYGTTSVNLMHDATDLIGIRTLLLRQYWSVTESNPSQTTLDGLKPGVPGVPGGLMLMGEQTVKERGRYATIWTFQGINGDGKGVTFKDRLNSIDYGFDPGFSQVPIQVGKNFSSMLEKFQGYPSNDGTSVIWPAELGDAATGGRALSKTGSDNDKTNPMYGIQAFFEMDGIYHFRYAASELPVTLQSGVGFIAETLPGKAPKLEDGRNWLMAPARWQRKGVVYDITEFYWLSRVGGWPEPVYRKDFFNS
ncbi:MAG: hypothetical protein ABI615_01740 [Chthoniobacterales bacterium]